MQYRKAPDGSYEVYWPLRGWGPAPAGFDPAHLEQQKQADRAAQEEAERRELKDPYSPAEDWQPPTFNGWLTEKEIKEWKARWMTFLRDTKPLTRSIYRHLPDEARHKLPHPLVWSKTGGIEVQSGGPAAEFMHDLRDEYSEIAKRRSWEVRLQNGWTLQNGKPDPAGGWVYGTGTMVDPQGRSHGPNGQKYGPYAQVEISAEEQAPWWGEYLQKEADPKTQHQAKKDAS